MPEHQYVVLFADISGSMQLRESLGDKKAEAVISVLQRNLSLGVDECGGVVQGINDEEIVARFVQADAAVQCAALLHQTLGNYVAENELDFSLRVGMHWGLAVLEKGNLSGEAIDVAAGVAAIAQSGQTISTEALMEQVSPRWRATAKGLEPVAIDGSTEPVVIFDLPSQPDDATASTQGDAAAEPGDLVLSYGDQSVNVGSQNGVFSIGRALNNDLVVDAGPVSRRHITIERIQDRFVVSDKSTNGTHIYIGSGDAVYLRRGQLPIEGEGTLALGAPTQGVNATDVSPHAESDTNARHVIRYSCKENTEDTKD